MKISLLPALFLAFPTALLAQSQDIQQDLLLRYQQALQAIHGLDASQPDGQLQIIEAFNGPMPPAVRAQLRLAFEQMRARFDDLAEASQGSDDEDDDHELEE